MDNHIKSITVNTLLNHKKEGKKITSLTAYDYSTAKIADQSGVDFILVGDSLAMVALGHENTLSVTVEEMLHHTKAVTRAVKKAMVVADMPFMSCPDEKTALYNAGRFIKEAGANAVKIEGGYENIIKCIKSCVEAGIPVLGHLGFTPQYLQTLGGYNVQGKNIEAVKIIFEQAKNIEKAGAFGIVLEMIPEESAAFITENLSVPTIGIGSGRYCSGQILVTDDILGKYQDFTPKFAKKYADISDITQNAISEFINDVTAGKFPTEEHIFTLNDDEKKKLEDFSRKNF